jgi:hypothetical protein
MGLQEIWWGRGIVDWVDLTEDREVAGSCEHIEPSGSIKCWEVFDWPSN